MSAFFKYVGVLNVFLINKKYHDITQFLYVTRVTE